MPKRSEIFQDFPIPPTEAVPEAERRRRVILQGSEALETVGFPAELAEKFGVIHIWDTRRILRQLILSNLDSDKCLKIMRSVRTYRESRRLTLVLSKNELIRIMGEDYARVLENVDLADPALVHQVMAANPPKKGIVSSLDLRVANYVEERVDEDFNLSKSNGRLQVARQIP